MITILLSAVVIFLILLIISIIAQYFIALVKVLEESFYNKKDLINFLIPWPIIFIRKLIIILKTE